MYIVLFRDYENVVGVLATRDHEDSAYARAREVMIERILSLHDGPIEDLYSDYPALKGNLEAAWLGDIESVHQDLAKGMEEIWVDDSYDNDDASVDLQDESWIGYEWWDSRSMFQTTRLRYTQDVEDVFNTMQHDFICPYCGCPQKHSVTENTDAAWIECIGPRCGARIDQDMLRTFSRNPLEHRFFKGDRVHWVDADRSHTWNPARAAEISTISDDFVQVCYTTGGKSGPQFRKFVRLEDGRYVQELLNVYGQPYTTPTILLLSTIGRITT